MAQCIGKRKFDNREEARVALELIRASPAAWEREKVPRRYYECDVCLGWHLSAMPEKGVKKRKKGVIRG